MQDDGSKQRRSSQQDVPAKLSAAWTTGRTSMWIRLGSLCLLLIRGKNWPLFRAISWILRKVFRNTALAASTARLIRSRPLLGGLISVGGLLVWVYVEFQPAGPHPTTPLPDDDPVFVFDDDGPLDRVGLAIVDLSAGGSATDHSAMSFAGSGLEKRLGRGGFLENRNDENRMPSSPRDAAPVEISEKRAVWLTGTIEVMSQGTPTPRTVRSDRFLPSRK